MDKKYIKMVLSYIKFNIVEQITSNFLLLVYSLTDISFPYILGLIIDEAIQNKDVNKLIVYTMLLVGVVILMIASNYINSVKFLKIGQKITFSIKMDIINKLNRYSSQFFKKYSSAEILSIMETDISKIEILFTKMLSSFIVNLVTTIGLFIALLYLNKVVFLVSIFMVVIYTYIQYKCGRKVKVVSLKLSEVLGDVYSVTEEIIAKIFDIRLLKFQKYFKERYTSVYSKYYSNELDLAINRLKSVSFGLAFQSLGIIFVIGYGGYMVLTDVMSFGVLFSLTVYIQKIYNPILALSNSYMDIKNTQGSFKRIFDLLDSDEYLIQDGTIELDKKLEGDICLEKLSYGFEGRPLVNDVNLKINSGDKIALVGSNGSGKSTLIKILTRIQENYTGDIFLGSHKITDYKLGYLYNNVMSISQEPFIFNGSIRENILADKENVSEEDIDRAIELACLKEDIDSMEDGLDTIIMEKGIMLSGGQMQKLSLSRVFLNKPSILILDEPTSALDIKSEEIICENIMKYYEKSTVIIISHREKVLEYCDKIIRVKDNVIKMT